MTHSRPDIRALLDRAGRSPRRDLGQNFVADPNTVRRIAELAEIGPGDRVVEVGAGLGSLTIALAETGAEVLAVEIDHELANLLREVTSELSLAEGDDAEARDAAAGPAEVIARAGRVRVVEDDAMALDWDALLGDASTAGDSPGWVLVANLPYNVATPLVCDLLDGVPAIERMLVMVQREVAERFAAAPGSKAYGAVSVKIAHWADARVVARVPASVFVPKPNVESALVDIRRHRPPDVDRELLFELVRTGFGQRRKMLRRSLGNRVDGAAFAAAEVSPQARPEQLDLAAWCRLTDAVTAGRAPPRPQESDPA